jgi:hypothetical protein
MCCKRCSLSIRAALVATQLCGKHISAAVNQHATAEEVVFSGGAAARLYNEDITQLELDLSSGVRNCSMELRVSAVEAD